MKKLVLLVALVMTTLTFAQETEKESKLQPYVAMGLSVGDIDSSDEKTFETTSYVSAEVGVMYKNLSFGAILGRKNLVNIGNENLDKYYYQGKLAVSTSLGYVDGYALVGLGSYFGNDNGDKSENRGVFTEYGLGISKQLTNKIGAFIQVSNWDGITYVTPGLSYSL